jgi:hypothetical protein
LHSQRIRPLGTFRQHIRCTAAGPFTVTLTRMRAIRSLLLMLALLAPAPLAAQQPQSRALATTLGGLSGIAAGGYLSVSVVVLEARFGRYVHDVDDILGWRAAPIIIGALAGAGLGLYSPERLQGAIVYGAGGLLVGGLAGLVVGSTIWEPPEGRWAGAAIGAGVGLVIGNTIGVLSPLNLFTEADDGTRVETTGVPIIFRIPL